MKKTILFACAVVISLGALSAQSSLGGNERFGATNSNWFAGGGIGGTGHVGLVADIDGGYIWSITNDFTLGAGIGILCTKQIETKTYHIGWHGDLSETEKIYGRYELYSIMRYNLPVIAKLSFFAQMELGITRDIHHPESDFLWEPAVGINLNRNIRILLSYGECTYYGNLYLWLDNGHLDYRKDYEDEIVLHSYVKVDLIYNF